MYNEISEASFNHFQSQMQLSPESHLAWRLQTHWLHSRCPSPALQRCTCRTPWTAQTTLRQLLHCQSTTTSTHHQSVTLQRFAASAFYLCSFHLSAWGFFCCFPDELLGLSGPCAPMWPNFEQWKHVCLALLRHVMRPRRPHKWHFTLLLGLPFPLATAALIQTCASSSHSHWSSGSSSRAYSKLS